MFTGTVKNVFPSSIHTSQQVMRAFSLSAACLWSLNSNLNLIVQLHYCPRMT